MIRVFRPGVFDLFHIGHLNCIQRAAEHGDYLIVGVQDDRDVKRCKGNKPCIPIQDRMSILSAFEGVDEVISYRNANLSKLLDAFKIDILAVGDDYGTNKELPEQAETLAHCKANKIKVIKTPRTNGVSTTDIKKQVADKRKAVQEFWDNTPNTMLTSFNGEKKLIDDETLREIELFANHIEPDYEVLDLGCGDGRITIGLANHCKEIVGVDFSKTLINKLNTTNVKNLTGIQKDVCEVDLEREFNVIIMSGLFPCLDDEQYRKVLKVCQKHVKPYGTILIRTSVADNERINVINQFSEGLGKTYTAYYRTKLEIVNDMSTCGFWPACDEFLYRNQPDTHVAFFSFYEHDETK